MLRSRLSRPFTENVSKRECDDGCSRGRELLSQWVLANKQPDLSCDRYQGDKTGDIHPGTVAEPEQPAKDSSMTCDTSA